MIAGGRLRSVRLVAVLALAACGGAPEVDSDSELGELYAAGIDFASFLEAAEARRDTWHDNYAAAVVNDELLQRARAAGGPWRLLIVAEDWCGDSANTIPYVARLLDQLDQVEMRIVDSEAGRSVMDGHPTPDGRGATPTVVLLDAEGREVGCFIERPANLQEWFLANESVLHEDTLYAHKYAWYDEDSGESTIGEIVAMLAAAAAGQPECAAYMESTPEA